MLSRSTSCAVIGLEAVPVEVEVDLAQGLPTLNIVGLPDQAVKEARERVRAAIINSQYDLPSQRLTVNLAPADIRKVGGNFDLAIALGILAASGQLDPSRLASIVVAGELALDGNVRAVHGTLVMALGMSRHRPTNRQHSFQFSSAQNRIDRTFMVPFQNTAEVSVVREIRAVPVRSLSQAVDFLSGKLNIPPPQFPLCISDHKTNPYEVDFADVKGQLHAKRAIEVAAAGRHHVLLIGPPGSGKNMLAKRLPTIQPKLSLDEALEATKIHSVAGLLDGKPLLRQRPFRAPHHTSSAISLVGGGSSPKPGEISLAHHGVLFLDELSEFHRDVLESLRQPLEEGSVTVARAKRTIRFPANFLLVGAMNPCPCGYLTDQRRNCRCSSTQVARYLGKLSGPLLDRIDMHIEVSALPVEVLRKAPTGESSAQIRTRVLQARMRQRRRLSSLGMSCNAQLRHKDLKTICPLSPEAETMLQAALREFSLSARAHDKILNVVWT